MRNNNVIFLITLLFISQINKDTVSIKKEVDDEKTKITITIEHNNKEKIPEMISSLFDTSNNVIMDRLKDYYLDDQKPEQKPEFVPESETDIQ